MQIRRIEEVERPIPREMEGLMAALNSTGAMIHVAAASADGLLLIAKWSDGTVRIANERGKWFVELAPNGQKDYFDSEVWDAALESRPVNVCEKPVGEQASSIAAIIRSRSYASVPISALISRRDDRSRRRIESIAAQIASRGRG